MVVVILAWKAYIICVVKFSGHKLASGHGDFGMEGVQSTSMDMSNLADPEASNQAMDSDDLMPSLQVSTDQTYIHTQTCIRTHTYTPSHGQ